VSSNSDRITRKVLDRLDVNTKDCLCSFEFDRTGRLLPCVHVLAAPDHDLSILEWGRLLRDKQSKAYTGRPRPYFATDEVPGTAEKIEVMRKRVAARCEPCHPEDADLWDAAKMGERLINGASPTELVHQVDERHWWEDEEVPPSGAEYDWVMRQSLAACRARVAARSVDGVLMREAA